MGLPVELLLPETATEALQFPAFSFPCLAEAPRCRMEVWIAC